MNIEILRSQANPTNAPLLSVLIPYYKDDASELLEQLLSQCDNEGTVEIILYDDGGQDAALNTRLRERIIAASVPVRLLVADTNKGRSFARNKLVESSKSDWVLFLDADMRLETSDFISNYINEIKRADADVIFGGFSVPTTSSNPNQELHRAFSETSDCLTLEDRQNMGAKYVATSNLCVRKTVLAAEPFDPSFAGWGWEDSEWAARIDKNFKLIHIDNPALHIGLETSDSLLSKFKNSGKNYRLFTEKHPDFAKNLTLYRAIQRLKRIPGQKYMRPALGQIARNEKAPMKMRLIALKLWRASWYAEDFA